jgi:hypothetical protein
MSEPHAGRAEPSTTEGLCERAISRALGFLGSRQEPDGAWRGDYGGPLFLLPMYLAAHHIGGRPVEPRRRKGMLTYLSAAQHADGSFGLHVESSGCLFTTVLSYVAFRLLGLPADNEHVARARAFILEHGTALACASWGKFILALLNLYDYEGLRRSCPSCGFCPSASLCIPAISGATRDRSTCLWRTSTG